MVVPEQCTKSSVLTVVRRRKFLSSQQKVDQFTVGTVTKSIEGTRSPLKGGLDTLPLFFSKRIMSYVRSSTTSGFAND